MLTARGYTVEVEWDGQTLVARPTNAMSRGALLGFDAPKDQTEARIPASDIARATFKDANPMVNGNLVVHTRDGKKYQLHFRRKQREEFRALADAMGIARA